MGSGATPVQVVFNENDAKFRQLNKRKKRDCSGIYVDCTCFV